MRYQQLIQLTLTLILIGYSQTFTEQVLQQEEERFEFIAQDYCEVLSGFKLGHGCVDTPFDHWDDEIPPIEENIVNQKLISERLSSKLDLMQEVEQMAEFRGYGWGKILEDDFDWWSHYQDCIDSTTWTLNDVRKNIHIKAQINNLKLNDYALYLIEESPEDFIIFFGEYFVLEAYKGAIFEGNFILQSLSPAVLDTLAFAVGRSAESFLNGQHDPEYLRLSQHFNGHYSQKMYLKAEGHSVNALYNSDDLIKNYESFKQSHTNQKMVSLILARYDELPQVKAIIAKTGTDVFQKLRSISKNHLSLISQAARASIQVQTQNPATKPESDTYIQLMKDTLYNIQVLFRKIEDIDYDYM